MYVKKIIASYSTIFPGQETMWLRKHGSYAVFWLSKVLTVVARDKLRKHTHIFCEELFEKPYPE